MIYNIQALRAFAALNVVMFHVIGIAAIYDQDVEALSFLAGWGKNGVDIFFVISGFVMGYSQAVNPKTWRAFLRGRIVRIVPIYWLLTLLLVALYLASPSTFDRFDLSGLYVLSSLFFFATPLFGGPLLDVGWTLEWEMLFYFLFAASLALATGRQAKMLLVGTMGVLIVTLDLTLLLEFIFGLLVAHLFLTNRISTPVAVVSFVFGSVLLVASSWNPFVLPRAIFLGVPSFFIVLGAVGIRQSRAALPAYLGAASYSIYLVQVFTIPAFYKLSSKFLAWMQTDLLALLCLVVTAVAGCLFYSFVEAPLTQSLRKRRPLIAE